MDSGQFLVVRMILAMALWVLAMIAGLCWARWAAVLLTGSTLLAFVSTPSALLDGVGAWGFQVLALGVPPWFLTVQRRHHHRRLKRLQARESVKLGTLQEQARALLRLQRENEQRESQVAQITTLYHVTKQTARALHAQELFAFSLSVVPRLLDLKGLRLVDLSHVESGSPVVLRARRATDGRLLEEAAERLLPIEQAVIQQATASRLPATSQAVSLQCELPAGVSRLAWAGLWGEQRAMGVVMADDLPAEQLDTFSVVANQLALQLARVHFYEAVESLAITDTLTGLSVRRYFLEMAAEELLRSRRHRLPCTVIMADLDNFKTKNDTYGHLVGDVVLREVSQLIQKNLRGIDLIARYGGEEFILLLLETGPDQGLSVADRLRQLVEVQPIRAYDEVLNQTISIGVACFPEDGQELQELIDHADAALYQAKREGRNRVVRWSNEQQSTVHRPPSTV